MINLFINLLEFSPRKITLSTAGIILPLKEPSYKASPVKLAISVMLKNVNTSEKTLNLPIEKYLLPHIASHNENLLYGMHFRGKFPPFDSINPPQWHLSGIFLLKIPL